MQKYATRGDGCIRWAGKMPKKVGQVDSKPVHNSKMRVLAAVVLALYAQVASAAPPTRTTGKHDGAHARVAFGRAGQHASEAAPRGRRAEPLTPEEDTAREIEKLLRGPLRYGTTGLYVVDAKTGEALFAVNADDPLNPASNVKMISTAAALELLGADFRYATRGLAPAPHAHGAIPGNAYRPG